MVSEESLLTRLRARSLDDLLLETINDVLKQVFGEESAKIILQYVKSDSKWEENPADIEVFVDAIRKILGAGTAPLENLILKSLYATLQLKFEEKKGYSFSDYVRDLRNCKFDRNITRK